MRAHASIWLLILLLAPLTGFGQDSPRKANPFAPSLPLLSDDEEAKIDRVIDRFMLFDTGKLRGAEGKAAFYEFSKLGPEAIPALIRGLNRAARIEHSCPAVVIAKKLQRMLLGSQDTELLEFARDEIGAGVGATRHKAVLQELRVACMIRKNTLVRAGIVPPKTIGAMTTAELSTAAAKETGPRLKEMLGALEQRHGPEVLQGLGRAAMSTDKEVQQLGRELLDKHLYRQPMESVKKSLRHDDPEVRRAATRLVAARMPALTGDLIDLLNDAHMEVRQAAHEALVALNRQEDLGPAANVDQAGRDQAVQKWRAWWESQKNR